jgi:ABC-type sugar transport system, permease component
LIKSNTISRKIFEAGNYTFLILLGLLCLMPFIHVLAISLSSTSAVNGGYVKLWPVDFNLNAYSYIIGDVKFINSFLITIERVAIGTVLSLTLVVLTAYPLSKKAINFPMRNVYAWYFVITMLVSGGLIPTYITIKNYDLIDKIFALVLPGAVPVYYMIIALNYFCGLPKELEESAFIDGAGHWTILFRIFIPVSVPVIATVTLFIMVGHWNAWFDGLIYMNKPEKYPLQTYLQTIVTQPDLTKIYDLSMMEHICPRTVKTAQIFVGMLPILMVYPFMQRYFIKGIVLGSVKG